MSSEIVPRWEWRTFGESFPGADERLDALDPESVQESDELYLLSTRGDASVKVRDSLLDIKRREQVGDNGLELWRPVLKASFPLSAEEVAGALRALHVAVIAPDTSRYTWQDFESECIAPNPDLVSLPVRMQRAHYTVDDCMVERSEVSAERGSVRTIAIESSDPQRVLRTIQRLRLDGRRNVNVARGLKTFIGFGAQQYAVIDVGTNSVKFHVGELQADGARRTLIDRADVTRLGEDLDRTGRLADRAIERTVTAIASMVDEAHDLGVGALAAVGTAGLRIATNRDAFVDAVGARTGIVIEAISGEEEARLGYLAATSALPPSRGARVVFDSGGGSSQFTFGHGANVDERFSVNVGAVRFTERFSLDRAVTSAALDEVRAAIAADLGRLDGRRPPDAVVGMGGTATNLAAVRHGLARYDAHVVQGTVLDSGEIDRQIELYRTRSADERRSIAGLQPNRAEVILAGACIVRAILDKLGVHAFTVSDRGLRHGVAAQRFTNRSLPA